MNERFRDIVVAGTAGGVGTTTVTALLFDALRQAVGSGPGLLDHTAGVLVDRAPGWDAPGPGDLIGPGDAPGGRLRLHDLGRHALIAGTARLADPSVRLVLVSAATPAGCALATQVLETVSRGGGASGLSSTVVVLTGVFGRHRIRRLVLGLAEPQPMGVVTIPDDLALAAGGRIRSDRLSGRTRAAVGRLAAAVTSSTGHPVEAGHVRSG